MTAQATLPEYEAILASCVDRIERGETARECLSGLPPKLAADLAPSLRAAERLMRVRVPAMNPDAMLRIEDQLLARAEALTLPRRELQPSRTRGLAGLAARFGALIFLAVLTLVMIVLGGGGLLVVSARSLPGAPLYPVKRAAEQVQLTFTQDPARRATLHTTFALRRLKEAVNLNKEEKRWDSSILKDMEDELSQAAGQASARIVWEHIADAISSGEEELAVDAENETVRATMGVLRQFHARADEELGRDGDRPDDDRPAQSSATPMSAAPTEAPAMIATTASDRRDDEAESDARITPDESPGAHTQDSGAADGHEGAAKSADETDSLEHSADTATASTPPPGRPGSGDKGEGQDSGGAESLQPSGDAGEGQDSSGAESLQPSGDKGEGQDSGGAHSSDGGDAGEGQDSGGAESLQPSGDKGEGQDSGGAESLLKPSGDKGEGQDSGGAHSSDGGEHNSEGGKSGDD